ncbi:E set domain-containing protein [Coccomyxa subellipsoidea C-169]|uniref:E set domain-containing protein n=1 Tax=Coccomyxa subellipsoidea (strain C-169) TaxID=574566 RepID=I0YXP6_COCSC|nr:E set domain-containing protein [Coccomyxa subellipsoidea C-169]EIE23165.1 E set domain-containing protein [Coccomyxa subellipsoidea C-169]|eukprot:XP_005647709.1 E set domain-containing protein [Coccomyxa subellipsoidea C-169]
MFEMDWDVLVLFCLAMYLVVSIVFAALFYITGAVYEQMLGDSHLSLPEACFWLSVTNLTTIGYGSISPDTQLAYIVCTVEHFVGIMMSSLLLGIVFAKASMPTNKTAFSRVCLITARNGVPHLLIRIGNTRGNFLLHPEGRRCEVTDPTAIAPSLIIAHEIDEASPLHGLTAEDIRAAEGAIFVSVAATDDNSKQSVIARTIFRPADILWNHRFQDVLVQKDGRQFVDFTKFHDTVQIEEQRKADSSGAQQMPPYYANQRVKHADILGKSGDMQLRHRGAQLKSIPEGAEKPEQHQGSSAKG